MAISVESILKELGYEVEADVTRTHLEEWSEAYKGKIKGFHNYSEYNGDRLVDKERKTLGMAKKCCEDWADNIFNDNVYIQVDEKNEKFKKALSDVWKANKFRRKFTELLELTFSQGTGAIVEFKENNVTKMNYYNAKHIYPLKVENGEIISCAFTSNDTDNQVWIQIHDKQSSGSYKIINRTYQQSKDNSITLVVDGLKEEDKSKIKLFQILKPNIVNNFNLDSGMGISCYANAFDELKKVDKTFDSYDNEIEAGRKRVFVLADATQVNISTNENTQQTTLVPLFDPNQTTFYRLPGEKDKTVVQETQGELRVTDLTNALQTDLNLFGRKVGLGGDYYSFKDGTVYTNQTQVISSNSAFYKTLKKHEIIVLEVIEELVNAIHYLLYNKEYQGDVTVDFDDSIVEDTAEIKRQAMLEFNAELIDEIQYYQDVYKMTEKQAMEFYEKLSKRKADSLEEDPPPEE